MYRIQRSQRVRGQCRGRPKDIGVDVQNDASSEKIGQEVLFEIFLQPGYAHGPRYLDRRDSARC